MPQSPCRNPPSQLRWPVRNSSHRRLISGRRNRPCQLLLARTLGAGAMQRSTRNYSPFTGISWFFCVIGSQIDGDPGVLHPLYVESTGANRLRPSFRPRSRPPRRQRLNPTFLMFFLLLLRLLPPNQLPAANINSPLPQPRPCPPRLFQFRNQISPTPATWLIQTPFP